MNAHRQDMVNVELTKEEVIYAIECAILSKYSFLDKRNGWDLQDLSFHDKNLNSCDKDSSDYAGVTFFYVKDIEVDDAPPNKNTVQVNHGDKHCGSDCGNCLNSCR
jgi:hypothetical protein